MLTPQAVNLTEELHRYRAERSSFFTMPPATALPISGDFDTVDDYVDSLLQIATTSTLFQTLCGGVHILDFFTQEPSLFDTVIPEEWKSWLMNCGTMELLDLLIRDELEALHTEPGLDPPPYSLVEYIKDIRKHSLRRSFSPRSLRQKTLPRHVAVGMIPKKIHEVTNFADYVVSLSEDIATTNNQPITHFVDFGSGQNYLGRALASPPYNKHIIAVESKELNINGAKSMDVLAKLAEREIVMRNKKLYRQTLDNMTPREQLKDKALRRAARPQKSRAENVADLRPNRDLATIYKPEDGKGSVQYVEHVINDGDLSDVVQQIKCGNACNPDNLDCSATVSETPTTDDGMAADSGTTDPRLMAISVHSCGNLSHHGIRSLLLNPSVQAIAIVGCCYNLLTERLGPPTYKLPLLRPNLQPINARVARESAACDPHGFPMSERIGNFKGDGIRLNITARMMAVQAPQNWTEKESDAFFTRHFFRALLQKVFLDRGVVQGIMSEQHSEDEQGNVNGNPKIVGTDPVIIGSLRKGCYDNFTAYVRGAIAKMAADPDRGRNIYEKMSSMTDEGIEEYSQRYSTRKKELSIMWSLMAFSAGVVESLIVTDRWLYLREHEDMVRDCWVEAIFDYKQSPRNLVVVGIKK
jgi:hypothetical protein